ncbi:protein kintoun [Anoplophora glabripennis]|uniref:protein kintoun n=1 Tax=Anoplophora glabripennis TaxID=217634 RepID=UPI0008735477|nr:protein kintoun [Anoplophora glabripennis]
MANSFDKLRELDLSRDEVERIGEALKNKEFRKLLSDYVEEVQNPENKKLYEKEITQLEKERGVDVTFIHPKPGYVIKTSVNGNQKAFINICANDHIKKPSSSPTIKEGEKGLSWSLPHSLSPPREDVDNKGVRCQVFDVVFHPDTLHLAEKNKTFRTMVNSAALDAVESSFDVSLDKKNLKFPKLSYKGVPRASVIRKPSETKPVERLPEEKEMFDKIYAQMPNVNSSPSKKPKKSSRKSSVEDKSVYATPKYVIKHRSHVDIQEFTEHKESKMNAAIPKELIVEINLPLIKSATDITLDVTEKTVQLVSEKPAKYKLNLTLPYNVNESVGNAKFDKDLKKLVVTLPVKRNTNLLLCDCKDDSGVESDQFSPGTPESEEEVSEKQENRQLVSEHKPSEKCTENSSEFRTKFLDENIHYNLPEFTCHVFENIIAFTLNVKNVDENSVGKFIDSTSSSIHIKFTSIGSSYYPSYYAFFLKFLSHRIDEENTTIEVWDNNVVLQIHFKTYDKQIKSYLYGVAEENLTEKYVEEPEILNQILEENKEDGQMKESDGKEEKNSKNEIEKYEEKQSSPSSDLNSSVEEIIERKTQSKAIDIVGTSYESSGDELSCNSYSPRKSKGILKRLPMKRHSVGRSVSESSLDDFICSSSFENCHTSLDSVIPEDGEISTSLKKTVRFNDVVMRQLFRSNSSILGQKKKNQRKSKNKKRAQERRHSESEASESDDKKERDSKDCEQCDNNENEEVEETNKKEDHDIFQIDIDN